MLLDKDFDRAFHPASIAVVGVSSSATPRRVEAFTGGTFTVRHLLDLGFEGRIYPINPRAGEIMGLKAYPSVSAVPERVDLVIVAVQAPLVPAVLRDCVKAGALNVHVMTSGFGETQQEEGKSLQAEVRRIALDGGIRLIGPNCMGIQVPSAKMSTYEYQPLYSGPVAMVSQSGSMVGILIKLAMASRMGFSKMISCGNSIILDIPDYVEYLATDKETGIIGVYVEGVKDGRRLLETMRKINPSKPIIIWKVGLSESSARAALSHSGMLGGTRRVWDAFFKQTGAVRVQSVEELFDMMMTFIYMKPVRGNNAAVLTAGGGNTVAAGDICEQGGINAPALAPTTREKLLKTVSLVNQGVANPLDIPDGLLNPDLLGHLLPILANDPGIELIIINWPTIVLNTPELATRFIDCICKFVKEDRNNKPLAVCMDNLLERLTEAQISPWIQQLVAADVPVYDSLERACRALSGFIDYHRRFSGD